MPLYFSHCTDYICTSLYVALKTPQYFPGTAGFIFQVSYSTSKKLVVAKARFPNKRTRKAPSLLTTTKSLYPSVAG